MPEERQAPYIPDLNLEAEPLKLGIQAIEDAYALTTVKQTFWAYEWFRSQNHDVRWNAHDALYVGWIPPKYWEGTTTPRSALGMPITFSQIESAFPAIYQAIFVDDTWFQVAPEPGGTPEEAKAIQAHLKYALEHPRADYTGNAEIELELAIKQLLLHGNGGIGLEWDIESGHPRAEWVDLRDFYVDPGSPVPSIDASRSVIRRKLFTIDEIEEFRKDSRMRVPDKAVLTHMARNGNYVFADRTKQNSEALRGVSFNPAQYETSPVPAERKIECLIYYSKNRIIWVLNREWVVYNERNPYGFIPFCFAPCFPFPGRFYAMSYADVIENHQRYIEALYNGRLDELSLALRPPRVRKRGSILTPSQQRWAPGAVQEADDPKNDVAVLAPSGATDGIMGDIGYLEASVEKMTGVNGVTQSVPRPGNANRTATGMNLQAQGSAGRLWPIVKHIEDYLIIPMLYKMYRMVQVHTVPGQLLPALGQNDQVIQVGAEAFKQPVRFNITAASKMLTREKLAQVVPFLAQYMLNGPLIQGLQGMGQTVDFDAFAEMVQDATGTSSVYKLIRPMSPQETQAKQTPPPQVMLQQQQAQQDHQVRLQLGQMKSQTEIQKEQIKKQPPPPDPTAQQQQQMDLMKSLLSMAALKQKTQADQQTAQHKLVMDHLANQQKFAHERQANQQKMLQSAQEHRQNMIQQHKQNAQNMLMQAFSSGQKIHQGAAAGQQKIEQSKALTDHKMALDKQKAALAAKVANRQPVKKAA